jgi:hypothetical protein
MMNNMRRAIEAHMNLRQRKPDVREFYRSLMYRTKAQGERKGNVYFTVDNDTVSYPIAYGVTQTMTIEVL